jgi:signal transduction histidine kinase
LRKDSSRKSGIPKIGSIPWGTHFCYFYYSIEDLVDVIVPFFREGLKSNELCIWITSKKMLREEIPQYLKNKLTDIADLKTQLKIIGFNDFYETNNEIDLEGTTEKLKDYLQLAQTNDLDGIRLSGDAYWLKKEYLEDFLSYEKEIDKIIKDLNNIVFCTYPINKFIKAEVLNIALIHDFAIFKQKEGIKIIKSSEQEKLEREREKIQSQMHQMAKLNNVAAITRGFAHDFNNLLGLIKGYAEMARMKINQNDNQKIEQYLQEISKSIKSSSKLINRLLKYSKDETEKLKIEQVNVNETIKNLLDMLTHFIADNITIQTHLDSDIRNIEGDPGKIEEIMMNLIINARDALPEGGKIIIQTKHIKKEDLKSVHKKAGLDSDYIKISVEDTGIGMDEETQNMIFEPFFTTKKEGEGTGLGLTIVREFVSQHNGWIEVDSQKGQGTTFYVYLPHIHENITEQ